MIGVSSIKSTFIQFVDWNIWNGVAWWVRMINACMFRRWGLVFKHKDVQERAAWGVSGFLYIVFHCSAATFHQPGGASLAMGFVLTVLTIRFSPKIIPYFFNFLYTFPIQTRISLVTLVKPLQRWTFWWLSGRFPFTSEANDGLWNLITYCAATGGSLLVIGSAAGVAFMGLERKVSFGWRLDLPWDSMDSQGRSRGNNYHIYYIDI